MGLFCSKSHKQTANVSPNNEEVEKKPPGDKIATLQSNEKQNELAPSPPNEGPATLAVVEQFQEQPPTNPVQAPILNQESSTFNSIRVALIGGLESGKTTVCQQIKVYCKQPPHEVELRHRPAYINDFLFSHMNQLLELKESLGILFEHSKNKAHAEVVQSSLMDRRGRSLLPYEISALVSLWEDATIQKAYLHRSQINMNDSIKYFFDSIDRIADMSYVPSVKDLLMLYVPTVGIVKYGYEINDNNYSIYDSSGHMFEQKKRLEFCDGFDAIIFTLAISEFDQFYQTETGRHSRLLHMLNLLAETTSNKIFQNVPLFIFLNKVDIFQEKLAHHPLKGYFADYYGNSEKDALSFIRQLTLNYCSAVQPDNINIYFTTATSTRKMTKTLSELFKKIGKSKE